MIATFASLTYIVACGMVTVPGYSVHVAVALLVMLVPAIAAVIGPVNVSVAVVPLVRLVIVHMPVVLLYVPCVGVPAVNPFGNASVIFMLVAVSGPLLVAFSVNVPVPPTFTGVVPVLVMVKTALFTCVLAVVVGYCEMAWSCPVSVAVFVTIVPAMFEVAVPLMVKVADEPLARLAITHVPL